MPEPVAVVFGVSPLTGAVMLTAAFEIGEFVGEGVIVNGGVTVGGAAGAVTGNAYVNVTVLPSPPTAKDVAL